MGDTLILAPAVVAEHRHIDEIVDKLRQANGA
jgi:adenosylmethionine-8-amino-7-oxononanoate aminotransferase